VKYVLVRETEPLVVSLQGDASGEAVLDFEEQLDDTVIASSTIADIPVTPSMTARISIPDTLEHASDFYLDEDGDGTVDQRIPLALGTTSFASTTKTMSQTSTRLPSVTTEFMQRAVSGGTALKEHVFQKLFGNNWIHPIQKAVIRETYSDLRESSSKAVTAIASTALPAPPSAHIEHVSTTSATTTAIYLNVASVTPAETSKLSGWLQSLASRLKHVLSYVLSLV
jgi:hypothetical protein